MTLLYQNEIRLRGTARAHRFSLARVLRRFGTTLRMIHRAIAAAKIRRLRNELLLHDEWIRWRGYDAAKYPRQPLVLDEKWDR